MVKLKNLQRRMQVFNLEHETFLAMDGENGVGKPEALTLLPLETKEVHEDALACVEIKAAIAPRKGQPRLRVVQ